MDGTVQTNEEEMHADIRTTNNGNVSGMQADNERIMKFISESGLPIDVHDGTLSMDTRKMSDWIDDNVEEAQKIIENGVDILNTEAKGENAHTYNCSVANAESSFDNSAQRSVNYCQTTTGTITSTYVKPCKERVSFSDAVIVAALIIAGLIINLMSFASFLSVVGNELHDLGTEAMYYKHSNNYGYDYSPMDPEYGVVPGDPGIAVTPRSNGSSGDVMTPDGNCRSMGDSVDPRDSNNFMF